MSQKTTDDWPDLGDWLDRLQAKLDVIADDYILTPWTVADDPEDFEGLNLKQARAAEGVVVVVAALLEIPSFKNSNSVGMLHDIAGALRDVVMGGTPRLFKPVRPKKSGGGDGIDRQYLKVPVVLAVRFLIEAHGWSEARARKFVTETFADSGATGRKGGRLSASTVQDWCEKACKVASNKEDARIYSEVESRLQDFREDPQWPGREADSIAWVKRLAVHPLILSKYG